MKTFKNIISFCILLLSISCMSQNNDVENELKDCVNEKVNKKIEEKYSKEPFDFYEFILKVEEGFISNQSLTSIDKVEYLEFYKNVISTKNKKKYKKNVMQQNEIINQYGFDFNSFVINDNIFNQCPFKVSSSIANKENSIIYSQGYVLNKMMSKNYKDIQLFKELLNKTYDKSFEKIVYRAPIILIVMINLEEMHGISN